MTKTSIYDPHRKQLFPVPVFLNKIFASIFQNSEATLPESFSIIRDQTLWQNISGKSRFFVISDQDGH